MKRKSWRTCSSLYLFLASWMGQHIRKNEASEYTTRTYDVLLRASQPAKQLRLIGGWVLAKQIVSLLGDIK